MGKITVLKSKKNLDLYPVTIASAVFFDNKDTNVGSKIDNIDIKIEKNTQNISINKTDIDTLKSKANNNSLNIDSNTSDISQNTIDIKTNADNIVKNATDIKANTDSISQNKIDISSNTSKIAQNTVDININSNNIAQNTTDISNNATDIAENSADILANTESIAKNTADILVNSSNIAVNSSDIATNAGKIAENTKNITKNTSDISTNAESILANTVKITTNTESILANAEKITTNTRNIATNSDNIAANTENININSNKITQNTADIAINTNKIAQNIIDIATNTSNIAKNATAISNNTDSISQNTIDIATNTSKISTNTSNIATNTSNISQNATDIVDLKGKVDVNTTDIVDLKSKVETNTINIADNSSKIATNISNIAENTKNIAKNTTDITENTKNIAKNVTDITDLKSKDDAISSKVTTIEGDLNNLSSSYDETVVEVTENRKGYDGIVYANMHEARKADYEILDNKFGDFTHSIFSGIGSFKADNTKEGLVKEIGVNGRTLQNLAGSIYTSSNQSTKDKVTIKGDDLTYGSPYYRIQTFNPLYRLKANTTYTIIVNVLELVGTSSIGSYIVYDDGETIYDVFSPKALGINVKKFTTNKELKQLALYLPISTGTIASVKELMILEGDCTNTPISQLPYGEGVYSVGEAEVENGKNVVEVKSCGKNLFDYIEQGTINTNGELINYAKTTRSSYIAVKENTNYTISGISIPNTESGFGYNRLAFYDINHNFISLMVLGSFGTNSKIFSTPKNTSFLIWNMYSQFSTEAECKEAMGKINIQLEESSAPTSYEPYKESNIKYLLDEPLRSLLNGACDEIVGDKLIRRVGKVVLNGTQPVGLMDVYSGTKENTSLFRVAQNSYGIKKLSNPISDKFVSDSSIWSNDKQCIFCIENSIDIRILKTSLDGFDDNLTQLEKQNIFKAYLSKNPMTIYYELETPIITDIGIKTLKGYDGVTNIFMTNSMISEISAKVPIDITSEIEENRKDFHGNLYSSMYEARKNETAYLLDKINNAEYLEYTGSNITANNTYYGLTKDLSVKGRTLQNLLNPVLSKAIRNKLGSLKDINIKFKKGTTYTLITNIKKVTNSPTGTVPIGLYGRISFGGEFLTLLDGSPFVVGVEKYKFTIPDDDREILHFEFLWMRNFEEGMSVEYEYILLEGDHTNTPLSELPYIEGIQSTGETDLVDGKYKISAKTCGKNLLNFKNVLSVGNNIIELFSNGFKMIRNNNELADMFGGVINLELKPNTTYSIRAKLKFSKENIRTTVYIYDDNLFGNRLVNETNLINGVTFPTKNKKSIKIGFYFSNLVGSGTSWGAGDFVEITDIQLEEATTPTGCEPYKENTIEYLIDEPLRSTPNGTADEIVGNQLIRRVGKAFFDGNNITLNHVGSISETLINTVCFNVNIYSSVAIFKGICNNFPYLGGNVDTEHWRSSYHDTPEGRRGSFYLFISKSKLTSVSSNGLNEWLKTNPITVYYELATPIITELDEKLVLNTFDTTTHVTSDNYLLPTITTKVPSNVQAVVQNLSQENKELNNQVSTLTIENEELKEGYVVHDVKIADSEEAINFLLMNSLSTVNLLDINNLERGASSMPSYLAKQIYQGRLDYDQVVAKYPQFKEDIDILLKAYVENDGIIYSI